jgi:hypothetical protein
MPHCGVVSVFYTFNGGEVKKIIEKQGVALEAEAWILAVGLQADCSTNAAGGGQRVTSPFATRRATSSAKALSSA